MRADAARNRERILASARELFLTRGTDVPLDHVAQHAGVSIATFYRRFPDRISLVKAIALGEAAALCERMDATRRHLIVGGDGAAARDAWEAFVLDMAATPEGKLMPLLAAGFSELLAGDPEVWATHERVRSAVQELLRIACTHGLVRAELDPAEIMAFLMVASRPAPLLSEQTTARLTHRLLQVVLAGLRPGGGPITGEPVTAADLPAGPARAASTTADAAAPCLKDVAHLRHNVSPSETSVRHRAGHDGGLPSSSHE